MSDMQLTAYEDPALRMVVAAGSAPDPRQFWTTAADMIVREHGADRVVIEYSDGYAAGTTMTGDTQAGTQSDQIEWTGSDDRFARITIWPPPDQSAVLARHLAMAAELAGLVGRRATLEHERRLGTFLVELSRWMRAAATDPRTLLEYAVHSVMSLVDASGALVVERNGDGALAIGISVGQTDIFEQITDSLGDSIFRRVMLSEEPLLVERLGDEPDVPLPADGRDRLRGAMLVPLVTSSGAIGSLCTFRAADTPAGDIPFTLHDLNYLQAVASHIGGALDLAAAIEAAHEAARRLSAMVNGCPLPLTLVNRSGMVLEANPAWAALFGLPHADALRGRTLETFPMLLDRSTPAESINLCASGVPWRGRAEVTRGDEHRKCEAIFTALNGSEGDFLIALHDRTDEIRAQQELVASEKLATVGTIAGGVAHEVNNPLAAIRMEAELLLVGDAPPETAEAVKAIINEVDRAARIAKGLLRLSRQSDGRMEAIALTELLDDIVEVRIQVLAGEGTTLSADVARHLPSVFARAGDLEQVLLHIVSNAEHAVRARSNATIHLLARPSDRGVRITVDDSGPGVEASLRTRIFDPFFTTRAPDKGRGLGLAMCQRIAMELGGRIWIEDSPLGGARFVLELPRASS